MGRRCLTRSRCRIAIRSVMNPPWGWPIIVGQAKGSNLRYLVHGGHSPRRVGKKLLLIRSYARRPFTHESGQSQASVVVYGRALVCDRLRSTRSLQIRSEYQAVRPVASRSCSLTRFTRLKIPFPSGSVGSIPTSGANSDNELRGQRSSSRPLAWACVPKTARGQDCRPSRLNGHGAERH